MSRGRKLEKFGDILKFPNVLETTGPGEPMLRKSPFETVSIKGEWGRQVFQNDHPITVELACGRGEYTVEMARRYPHQNFIGVDIKGARIWKGARIALDEKLHNVAFLRIRIEYIDLYFSKGEADEIWITFPDPFYAKPNRRLVAPPFLDKYDALLKEGGKVHLKTDDVNYFQYAVECISDHSAFEIEYKNEDIYASPLYARELEVKTFYEELHLKNGKTIKYLACIHTK